MRRHALGLAFALAGSLYGGVPCEKEAELSCSAGQKVRMYLGSACSVECVADLGTPKQVYKAKQNTKEKSAVPPSFFGSPLDAAFDPDLLFGGKVNPVVETVNSAPSPARAVLPPVLEARLRDKPAKSDLVPLDVANRRLAALDKLWGVKSSSPKPSTETLTPLMNTYGVRVYGASLTEKGDDVVLTVDFEDDAPHAQVYLQVTGDAVHEFSPAVVDEYMLSGARYVRASSAALRKLSVSRYPLPPVLRGLEFKVVVRDVSNHKATFPVRVFDQSKYRK